HMAAAFGGSFGGGQLWVSTDGGATWTNRSAGLPTTPENTLIHDGTRFIVGGGQQFGSQNFGLYASSDLGVTWTPLHDVSWPSLVVNKVAVDPNNSAKLFAATVLGVFKSTDGGVSWQFGAGGTAQISANAVRFAP